MPYPEWLHIAFDGRFIEHAKAAADLSGNGDLCEKQKEVEARLKQELTAPLFQQILEWEEIMNYRATLEREWLYYAGIKDGLSVWKHLLDHVSD